MPKAVLVRCEHCNQPLTLKNLEDIQPALHVVTGLGNMGGRISGSGGRWGQYGDLQAVPGMFVYKDKCGTTKSQILAG